MSTPKLMPAGLDQQGRCATREWPPFADTVAMHGSADAIGDDQAERSSGWGALDECAAPEGGMHREPVDTAESSLLRLLRLLLWPVVAVASVAAVAALLPN